MFVFAFYNSKEWLGIIRPMFQSKGVGSKEGIVKHGVDAPMSGQLESGIG